MTEPVLRLVRSVDDATELLRWLGDTRREALAFDTETTGLRWWKDKIRLVQLGDTETGWAIPWEQWGGVAAEALRRWDGQLVAHNAPFDCHMLQQAGVEIDTARLDDTQVMAHLINPLAIGLKAVATQELGIDGGQWKRQLDAVFAAGGWDWDTVPIDHPAYWRYAASDTVLTAGIRERMVGDTRGELYETELGAQAIIADMETRGVRIDVAYAEEMSWLFGHEHDRIVSELQRDYGLENPDSSDQLAAALVAAGVELTERTPSGKLSTTRAILSQLDHPMAIQVMKARRYLKWKVSYFDRALELVDGDILHPGFKSLGARTGRMSASNPPMQQMPRGPIVRKMFIARPEHRLVLADYDQIEMLIALDLARPPVLVDAALAGEDLHRRIAAMSLGKDPDDVTTDERQTFKSAGYAKLYGAGWKKFALTAGVDAVVAEGVYAKYDAAIPELKKWSNDVIALARRRAAAEGVGYVITSTGRRLPCDPGSEFALVNYRVQGEAADVFKRMLIRLDRAGLSETLALLVHDEVILDVPRDEVDHYRAELPDLMRDDGYVVPLSVSAADYRCWADKYMEGKP